MVKEKKKKNDHGRGFKRTKKQWENSVADHIGKFVDKLTLRDVLYGLTFAGTAFTVYHLLPKAPSIYPEGKWQIAPFVYADKEVAQVCWVAESMAAAYMLLKLDVDDIVSGAKIAGSILSKTIGLV